MRLHLYPYKQYSPDMVSDQEQVVLQEFRGTFYLIYFNVWIAGEHGLQIEVNSKKYKA